MLQKAVTQGRDLDVTKWEASEHYIKFKYSLFKDQRTIFIYDFLARARYTTIKIVYHVFLVIYFIKTLIQIKIPVIRLKRPDFM